MPYSISSGKSQVKKYILENNHKRILDIGAGSGTYGKLLKDCGIELVGLDVIDYRGKFPILNEVYKQYHVCDMRDVDTIKMLGYFDVIILGDVLEHLTVEDAQKVIEEYKKMCDCLIIAVPYEYPQVDKKNHYENHIQDDLTHEIFTQRYPDFELYKQYKKNNKPHYGYYIWKRGK